MGYRDRKLKVHKAVMDLIDKVDDKTTGWKMHSGHDTVIGNFYSYDLWVNGHSTGIRILRDGEAWNILFGKLELDVDCYTLQDAQIMVTKYLIQMLVATKFDIDIVKDIVVGQNFQVKEHILSTKQNLKVTDTNKVG